MDKIPSKKTMLEAAARLKPFVHRTPVLTCSTIDDMLGAQFFFKCENFQKIGAFKFRGATNTIRQLTAEQTAKGVCTHSSGNHGQAVAYAARMLGIKAYIVVPSTAPEVKKAALRGYGADITECEPTLKAREVTTAEIALRTGATFINAYDDARIVAGQGTAAMELIEDVPDMDILMAPVGGGGLLGGTTLAAHYFSPGTKVIGAEPEQADDAFRSFHDKKWYPSENPDTLADGLLTSLGQINFQIFLDHLDDIVLCTEKEIVDAMRLIWERMKIIVEPSSAVPLATIMAGKIVHKGKKIGIILSGGNVDLGKLPF